MVRTGLSRFIIDADKYRSRRIGLIANQSSVHDYRYSWDIFNKLGLNVAVIFSPEHGLFSTEQDQVPVINQPEPGVAVVSLYGDSYESLVPDINRLHGIDTLIFDMQDVGSRYYTYVNTMALVMKAVSGSSIEFIVLDRPNPLGGEMVEGPLLDGEFESFVGLLPVPVRHGLTTGELAIFAKELYRLDINLTIIKISGWGREMYYPETGLPWIPPSPNMPGFQTALVYPGSCLFEGLNVSEGRGTATPFQVIGAPYIDPYLLAAELDKNKADGAVFRPFYFIPTFHKYAGEISGGIFIHVTDMDEFRPFRTGLLIVDCIMGLCPEMKFLYDVYEFNSSHPTFDLLTGGSAVRGMLEKRRPFHEITGSWEADEAEFLEKKERFHLY